MILRPPPSPHNGFASEHATILADSFQLWTGRQLLDSPFCQPSAMSVAGTSLAQQLFEAPFAIVSHNTEADPIFNYANQTALDLFDMTWEEFISLPSRLSAEPAHRDERARLMALVTDRGFIDDYQGVRIAKNGRRFRINGAIVWNLVNADGNRVGQAAAFHDWTFL